MVGYPHDVEEIYFGKNGIFQADNKGLIVIDMTTSTPTLAKKIDSAAKEKEMGSLDAPVSGGDIGAQIRKAFHYVWWRERNFDQVLPILSLLEKLSYIKVLQDLVNIQNCVIKLPLQQV